MKNQNQKLWYRQAARDWHEALPLGNGRIGAMVFGGVGQERIELNEDTIWSGRPGDEDGYSIRENIGEVRRLLREKQYSAANALTDQMTGAHDTQSYQMAGNLYLDFAADGEVADYRRELDMTTAVASTAFRQQGVGMRRECLVSVPHQLLALRLEADRPGALSFRLTMDSQMRFETQGKDTSLALHGCCPFCNYARRPAAEEGIVWDQDGVSGMRYVMKANILNTGGTVRADDEAIVVEGADAVTLLLAIKTGFVAWDQEPNDDLAILEAACDQWLNNAEQAGWETIRSAHVADYGTLYNRMNLQLGTGEDRATDELLHAAGDPEAETALVNQVFNFGRYLLISASRPGTQPANLQGIWNDKLVAPWRSNYTTNINTEMNYWPAETTNLADCAEPLFQMIRELSVSGRRPARALYNARGWCAHHNVDLWRYPYTGGSKAQHAMWPMCAPWLCQHVWEHFVFSGDRAFLAEFLPIMKEAAAFLIDFLVETDDGCLTTSPSTSPENRFIDPTTGEKASVCEGSAMDLTLIRELLENVLEASTVLGEQDELIDEIEVALAKLAMTVIGADGRLLEFGIEAEEVQPQHRHISHLYGVYPAAMFTRDCLPDYYEACRRSLDARGDESTGWAMAWRVAMWARFGEGDRAFRVIGNLLRFIDVSAEMNYSNGGGLYANLFDAHPPFQIDGNYGVTAGITEMLLQSHETSDASAEAMANGGPIPLLRLLPALPLAWPQGNVRGLRARGGFEVDMAWEQGRLKRAELLSTTGNPCELCYDESRIVVEVAAGERKVFDF